MEDFQIVLLVLGAIAIAAVLLHGFWSIRKQQPKSMKESPMVDFYKEQSNKRDAQGFDADGIGEVRVKRASELSQKADSESIETAHSTLTDELPDDLPEGIKTPDMVLPLEAEIGTDSVAQTSVDANIQADTSEIRQKPESHQPEQQTLFAESDDDFANIDINIADDEHTDSRFNNVVDSDIDPQADARANFSSEQDDVAPQTSETTPDANQALQEPKDVLVLHVVAKSGYQLQGAEILPCLLGLNFKFGDMEIFHRHIDNAGTGEVLFSLANMMKPGVFDPDNMEQFVTEGLVLFMTLPCYGDPTMNFTIMLNSALQIAEDLGAELLDGQRQPWADETKHAYVQRIKAAM
ncbi:cell division protein ZipA [Shewanella maritima]|uniref:cell division protein ZipA n=1 Tax=Shewanella maritima TaxID=2520507 RepID=UPI0037356AC7